MDNSNVRPLHPKEKNLKESTSLVSSLSPREIVSELDRFVVGQNKAKKAVAIALRNRWRRQALDGEMKNEVLPKNILMIGPTGVGKTEIAIEMFKEKTGLKNVNLIVAGGVAANKTIRENLTKLSKEINFKVVYPDIKFCGDNAAMIAWAGIKRFEKRLLDKIIVNAKSRWSLDRDAPYMKGPGLKL